MTRYFSVSPPAIRILERSGWCAFVFYTFFFVKDNVTTFCLQDAIIFLAACIYGKVEVSFLKVTVPYHLPGRLKVTYFGF